MKAFHHCRHGNKARLRVRLPPPPPGCWPTKGTSGPSRVPSGLVRRQRDRKHLMQTQMIKDPSTPENGRGRGLRSGVGGAR